MPYAENFAVVLAISDMADDAIFQCQSGGALAPTHRKWPAAWSLPVTASPAVSAKNSRLLY